MAQVTDVVGQECLSLVERFRGGLLGEGHSWVAAPSTSAHSAEPAAVAATPREPAALQAAALLASSLPAPVPALSAEQLEARILGIVARFLPNPDPATPLAAQGLDSLAALELRQKLTEATGERAPWPKL